MDLNGKKVLQAVVRNISELQRTKKELQRIVAELEQFNNLAVGRELQMVELKKEIDTLLCESDREGKYKEDYEKIESEPLG